jgi:UDP-N-acetylmuramoylalanine--D-glutamate ligase
MAALLVSAKGGIIGVLANRPKAEELHGQGVPAGLPVATLLDLLTRLTAASETTSIREFRAHVRAAARSASSSTAATRVQSQGNGMLVDGQRVTIMGLGHFGGGAAAARWLARQGARVTVTDLADESHLADALATLRGVPLTFHLGEHRDVDFRQAQLLVVNPAVKPGNRLVALAAAAGARITSEIELFLDACPAPVIGVTGSNGKSTTAAMTAAILRADGRRTWLGGNIGQSLLERLPEIAADHWVVLELSSFQLWYLTPAARGPQVAVVTNCTPNHLNWHPDFAHYVAAKQRLLTLQSPTALAVLNTADPQVAGWEHLVRGRLATPWADEQIPPLGVPGMHNRTNAACAAAAAAGVGCSAAAIARGLSEFTALEQRLELVATIGGRRFYNDSSATTPESTIEALRSLPPPIWLLAGGTDKGADLGPLLATIAAHAQGAAFYGAVGPRLYERLNGLKSNVQATVTQDLNEALAWCVQRAPRAASIVLSPGFSSHDQFTNYRERGARFTDLVRTLAGGPGRMDTASATW